MLIDITHTGTLCFVLLTYCCWGRASDGLDV